MSKLFLTAFLLLLILSSHFACKNPAPEPGSKLNPELAKIVLVDIPDSVAIKVMQAWQDTICAYIPGKTPVNLEKSIFFPKAVITNLLNSAAHDVGGLRIFFGYYDTLNNNGVKPYLAANEKEHYGSRFTVIISGTDNNGTPIPQLTKVNLGGLCPPDQCK